MPHCGPGAGRRDDIKLAGDIKSGGAPMTQELGVPAVEGQGSAQRLFREQDFHNRRFAEDAVDARTDVRRWYVAIREGRAAQGALLRQLGSGKAVLGYGCALRQPSIGEPAV